MTQQTLPLRETSTGCDRVLDALRSGEWTALEYSRLRCIVHSRVAELRRRGHLIECRKCGSEYEYRLVRES